ncbi:MAG: GyrI-like domain-containing protein, partial [Caulobacteraceae bacterium]
MSEPAIVERTAQPYVGIPAKVEMSKIASVGDTLPGELFGWLGAHGLKPAGAPFFRYYAIGADGVLDLEWGVPLAEPATGDARVRPGDLPAGQYASLIHVGPYSGIRDATASLHQWIKDQG